MNRTQHRFLSILATGTVALGLGAAPALAGSDGCVGNCDGENTPATVVPAVPTPVAPAPAPDTSRSAPERSSNTTTPKRKTTAAKKHTTVNRTVSTRSVAARQTTRPSGGVQAGAGGMAPSDSDGLLLLGLAGAGLALVAAGGRLTVAQRSRA